MRGLNDAKALALLKSGDQEALEWFIDKYSAYVGTVVNSIIASCMTHEDVEEVTADVFVTLWRSAENLYPLNLKGYLSRVARSLSMQKLREKVEVLPLDEDILILDEDSVFDSLEREDQDQLIRRLVYSMPQPDKEIFLRFYYYCQSVSVIANQMQMNPSTIKTKLKRGRERLRTFLSDLKNTKGGDLNANQHS
ncbi:MAG: sigma-70 family RNA polymerase sigma factor [Ruminococcaceae bacterium]|nr:sigma-70 family RNA polymerase sigma factor [Oscillospiraceae bacterium]